MLFLKWLANSWQKGIKKIRNLNIISLLRIIKVLKVGIEPTLPKKLDFESSASTNSAT